MQITSNLSARPTHVPSDTSQAETSVAADVPAHEASTTPSSTSSSMARFLPSGGLHSVAGGQMPGTTQTAKTSVFDGIRAVLNETIFLAVMDAKSAKVPVTKG